MRRRSVSLADVALRGDARARQAGTAVDQPAIGCHVPAGRAVAPHQHGHAGRDQSEGGDRHGRLEPGVPAQRHRPAVGPGRFTHPGRAAPWAGIHGCHRRLGASAVLQDPTDICPPLRMLGHKSMLGQKYKPALAFSAKHRNGADTHPIEGIMENYRFRAIGGRCPRRGRPCEGPGPQCARPGSHLCPGPGLPHAPPIGPMTAEAMPRPLPAEAAPCPEQR
jgi:hypothetical protein